MNAIQISQLVQQRNAFVMDKAEQFFHQETQYINAKILHAANLGRVETTFHFEDFFQKHSTRYSTLRTDDELDSIKDFSYATIALHDLEAKYSQLPRRHYLDAIFKVEYTPLTIEHLPDTQYQYPINISIYYFDFFKFFFTQKGFRCELSSKWKSNESKNSYKFDISWKYPSQGIYPIDTQRGTS